MAWRQITDRAKRSPLLLKLADRLGRGTGGFRVLDHLSRPPRPPLVPHFDHWNQAPLAVAWLGHATVLIRLAGRTILTDPVFSNRIGLGLGVATLGPRRLIAPPLSLSELPPVDLLLVSHAHFDHLDRPTLNLLQKDVPVLAAPRTRDLLDDLRFTNVTELHAHESVEIAGVRLTGIPVHHWGARTFYDTWRGYGATLLERDGLRVLYGADSAYHDFFKSLAPVDLAILGIGAYNPWEASHATPEQAWAMAGHCQARWVLPMHHSTFRLSNEPVDEPMRRLLSAAGPDADKIVIRQIGQQWQMPVAMPLR